MALTTADVYQLYNESYERSLTNPEIEQFTGYGDNLLGRIYRQHKMPNETDYDCYTRIMTPNIMHFTFRSQQHCNCCEDHMCNRPRDLDLIDNISIIGFSPVDGTCRCKCNYYLHCLRRAHFTLHGRVRELEVITNDEVHFIEP